MSEQTITSLRISIVFTFFGLKLTQYFCSIIYSEDSFNHLKDWLEEAKQYSRPEATFMILGNKRDLSINGERQVELLTSSQFAQENDCLLFETSALTGENVENAFYKIV